MGTVEKSGHKISGGLRAILTQMHEDYKERVVGYTSRKLKTHEENYPAYVLEMLAVTFGCEHYHHYQYDQKKFVVYSDHLPLSKLNKVHTKTQGRLKEVLLDYNYEIIYRRGEDQEAADFLSRNAIEELTNSDTADAIKTQCHKNLDFEEDFVEDDHGILWKGNGDQSKLLISTMDHVTDIIRKAHDSHIWGHWDSEKMLERIQRVYWWFMMRRDIYPIMTTELS